MGFGPHKYDVKTWEIYTTIGIYGGDDHGEDWVGFPGKFDKKPF